MRILVVEDDRVIATGLEYSLQQEGYDVKNAYSYKEAKEQIDNVPFDLYLLDITLPDGNGYDLCKEIKKKKDTPVIFLTALEDEVNVVMGLDFGADDYIIKPFRIRELMSRIRSVLRRYHKENEDNVVYVADIEINVREKRLYKNNVEIILTAMEFRLLLQLLNHRGQVLTRNQLLEGIWDVSGDFVNDNTLTVYIKRLREKLEDDMCNPVIIKTIRGIGYCIEK
ncbi:DNA-binding response regulator, OmpR family, contains REC and winged-helix (wHTH) domain [Anaerosporobacter mobilis DSM 15930]|jgi:DNA-binding response OmpR family regulator|uniref:Stage 0 sporulation protein A homolog n=1 Tax=Anaerosporobacter mobilis DSM 15930 TaxID=1120996 RepID=A0A1M7NMW4_9FIRM|nr:response regulator transcription factor [Anaerosporobacter mobilis]SHN05259.1 DNA-binding response regulator, OmpR family, contains REC and winged-helix (wHTH) domain [Anaerosporobacter mobilis DSM 15930]